MIVKVLLENTAISDRFEVEHGLSLYVETGGRKLLFDMGAGGLYLENAKKLGVDIGDVDFAVLSHGHSDHGGGLELFLEKNAKAKVFVHPKAFEKHYALRPDGRLDDIGVNERLKQSERIVPTGDRFTIAEDLELFSNVTGRELFSSANKTLLMESGGENVGDTFAHEQNLVVREGEKTVLIAGCAHNGIVNILHRFAELKGGEPNYVLGGFHLHPNNDPIGHPKLVAQIGERLANTGSVFYTGHCTGQEAYEQLRGIMGDKLRYLATGCVLEL